MVKSHPWFLGSSGHNIGVTIHVTDETSGAEQAQTKADLRAMQPVEDTSAFRFS